LDERTYEKRNEIWGEIMDDDSWRELEHWELATILTVAYCKECEKKDGVKACMNVVSEFLNQSSDPPWEQDIECLRCSRKIKQQSKVSRMFDALGAFD